jgi:drug/metabolite transporter (DMT)-like permease
MEKLLARLPPVVGASLATSFGGTAVIATRYVVGQSDSVALAFLRHFGCGLLVAALAWVSLGRRARIARADLLPITLLGLLQFALYGWLFTASLAYAPAARAALVMTSMPLATLLLATAVGRERFSLVKIAACALATAGVAIALGDAAGGGEEVWKGDALMGAAVVVGAIYATASGPYLKRSPSLAVAAYQILLGAAVLFLAVAWRGDFAHLASFTPHGWGAVLWLAGPAGVLPFYLWLWAFERTTPARVTITIALNPITAGILGALVLGEPVTWRLLAGLACIVAGIALAFRPLRFLREAAAD